MQSELESAVRVRFGPSPTGYPHVGNIRTALFNWLFARHHGGSFILRIEDTDVARRVEGAVDGILDGLRWLGLDWDEGPYFQSTRLDLYRETVDRLLEQGKAYLCYCSPERLEDVRRKQMERKEPPKYDRYCRHLTSRERSEFEAKGISSVVRFKTPLEGETSFNDLIRGAITFKHDTLDDFVLLKSDGYPTYHLASIVDDHLMTISHVLRADEWLSSCPRHILLYQAMDWPAPKYAHLPMILGPDKAKLSKRHGATTITEYRERGYVADAMVNFLVLLGWSLDDRTELLSREELIRHFSLERVGKTAAVFNNDKLAWMNGVYLRSLSPDEFARQVGPFLDRDLPSSVTRPLDARHVRQVLPLVQERAKTLGEVAGLVDFFFVDSLDYDVDLLLKGGLDGDVAGKAAEAAWERLGSMRSWDAGALEESLRSLASELDLGTRKLFGFLRIALTGRTAAPPLFQTMEVLGRDRCLERLRVALDKLARFGPVA